MKDHRPNIHGECLSDEILTLWSQGLLGSGDQEKVQAHLDTCDVCRDVAGTLETFEPSASERKSVPESVSSSAREFIARAWEKQIARIILKIKDGMYTAAQTTGEVLLAPWLNASVLTRAEGADAASVVVETVYHNLRCLIESGRSGDGRHTLKASFSVIDTGRPIGPTVFILREGDEEIESQTSCDGKVVFEDLPEGFYRLTMMLPDGQEGHLDIHLVPI